jgi:response regulator RpfG family c-di-GMP phosphodiesterase
MEGRAEGEGFVSEQARPRVLVVDDDRNLLDGLRRQLRGTFDVATALGGHEGLALLEHEGPFAAVMSDYQMPRMNGASFLAAARDVAPDATRMLLTGQADLGGAAAVVNQGAVFRFLIKPVSRETLTEALHAAVEQHRLVTSERELLEQTLQGSVKALTELLSLASPLAFARATRLRRLAGSVFEAAGEPMPWHVDLAVMLSQVGVITLPNTVLERMEANEPISPEEQAMVDRLPALAEQVLAGIPRLDEVRAAIRWQAARYGDPPGSPEGPAGDGLPLGARVLRLVHDYDSLEAAGKPAAEALKAMTGRAGVYDPRLLNALMSWVADVRSVEVVPVRVGELFSGLVLAEDVVAESGAKLLPRGHEITPSLLERLHNFSRASPVREPVRVFAASRRAAQTAGG